jgi:hypothetical protein
MNKFLNKYPSLWEPVIGDRVRVIQVLNHSKQLATNWAYSAGEEGEIVEIYDYVYMIKFDKDENYTVFKEEIELISHEQVS